MRCPSCGRPDLDPVLHDDAGMSTCRCGHRAYAGYLAEADSLDARLLWLTDRIRAGDPAPDPRLAVQYRIWPPPQPADSAAGSAGARPRQDHSVEAILLGVGALLLVVAGAVFTAVVWARLGAISQAILAVAVTGGIGALAIALRSRLAGTAEALAAVAAGLALVDLLAAPTLGLVPEYWLSEPTLYPAVALTGLAAVLLALHTRFGLRAWAWMGWLLLPAAAGCVVLAVGAAAASLAWSAAALSLPALVSVGLLAAAGRIPRAPVHRLPMRLAGVVGLASAGVAAAAMAADRPALPGVVLTTGLTALAVGLWARLEGRDSVADQPAETPVRVQAPVPVQAPVRVWGLARLLSLAAAALAGTAVGLALAIPPDPQPLWLAALVALAGVAAGLVAVTAKDDSALAVTSAVAVWIAWAMQRMSTIEPFREDHGVPHQLAVLCALVAVVALVVAWWLPWVGWVGALLAPIALALAGWTLPEAVEVYSLPTAVLLLIAGLLWRRQRPSPSLIWLGPAVAAALLPSAFATWSAPWTFGSADDIGWHLLRLGGVLVAGVVAVLAGARWQLGGLLIPGAVALVVAALGQVVGGLATLPRWIGLAIAGTLLIAAGARIESLRRAGRRAAGWVGRLR